ncbi:Auxin-independent growth promoter-like protein, mRNA [Zea mays]|uniref:O-fucosyltransferase family protein n=1 Tax=Zea mays TaxID=4577 RepID=A0A1D6LPB3_MAIZE|nr:Auxin-independent growth promoter-like protein, mRNA [Zea mays]
MAELRHATAAAAATRATGSPSKRDAEAASSPLVASPRVGGGRDGLRPHQRWPLPPPVRALLACEDPRSASQTLCGRILMQQQLRGSRVLSVRDMRSQANLVSENETSGFIFIHAEGGLNQQRIAICNAVAIAKIMNATLILPVLKQDQIWKDQTKFEDIFDVDHFINYLKEDVHIVRDIPDWFTEKDDLFTSIKLVVSFSAIHCALTAIY